MKIMGRVGCGHSAAWIVFFSFSSGLAAVGCGGDDPATQTAAGRAYDDLSFAVAGCAGKLSSCRSDAGTQNPTCQSGFQTCALSAGAKAEAALVEATSDCLAASQKCDAQAEDDASKQLGCDQRLRACLGDASPPSDRASGKPGEAASTFQCFGQLRDCVATEQAPKACSSAARDCVIHAISEPGSIPLPRDGGVAGAAGRGGGVAGRGGRNSGAAGRAGLAGRGGRSSGDAGDEAAAGRGTTRRGNRSSGSAGADMRGSAGAAQGGAGGSR